MGGAGSASNLVRKVLVTGEFALNGCAVQVILQSVELIARKNEGDKDTCVRAESKPSGRLESPLFV
jgi:hypothetical protein